MGKGGRKISRMKSFRRAGMQFPTQIPSVQILPRACETCHPLILPPANRYRYGHSIRTRGVSIGREFRRQRSLVSRLGRNAAILSRLFLPLVEFSIVPGYVGAREDQSHFLYLLFDHHNSPGWPGNGKTRTSAAAAVRHIPRPSHLVTPRVSKRDNTLHVMKILNQLQP